MRFGQRGPNHFLLDKEETALHSRITFLEIGIESCQNPTQLYTLLAMHKEAEFKPMELRIQRFALNSRGERILKAASKRIRKMQSEGQDYQDLMDRKRELDRDRAEERVREWRLRREEEEEHLRRREREREEQISAAIAAIQDVRRSNTSATVEEAESTGNVIFEDEDFAIEDMDAGRYGCCNTRTEHIRGSDREIRRRAKAWPCLVHLEPGASPSNITASEPASASTLSTRRQQGFRPETIEAPNDRKAVRRASFNLSHQLDVAEILDSGDSHHLEAKPFSFTLAFEQDNRHLSWYQTSGRERNQSPYIPY